MTTSTVKAYGHDRSNRFHTKYSCYRMTPTTRPKPQNPSTVFCWIFIAVVTVSLVVYFVPKSPHPPSESTSNAFQSQLDSVVDPNFLCDSKSKLNLQPCNLLAQHSPNQPRSLPRRAPPLPQFGGSRLKKRVGTSAATQTFSRSGFSSPIRAWSRA